MLKLNYHTPGSISTEQHFNTELNNTECSIEKEVLPAKTSINGDDMSCPLCMSGSLPSENGAHNCVTCGVPVHALSSSLTHKQGQDYVRICFKCSKTDFAVVINLSEENRAEENWNRKSKKQRNFNSYLCPNPNLRHLQMKNSKSVQSLPLLKNGSRSK